MDVLQMMPQVKSTEEAVTEHTSELVVPREVADTLIPLVPSDPAICYRAGVLRKKGSPDRLNESRCQAD